MPAPCLLLQDRPIQAKPPTPAARVVKWTRRHKYLVAAAAVLLVLGSVGLGVSNIMVTRERDQKAAALRVSAENLNYALDAIEERQEESNNLAGGISDFIQTVAAAQADSFEALGEGEDLRIHSNTIAGGALAARDRVVHLCAFSH